MKHLFFVIICMLTWNTYTFAQQKITIDEPNYLEGTVSQEVFKEAPYSNWFHRNYENYELDKATVKKIKKNIKGVTIKTFMGSWCGDSRREIPRLFKLLNEIGFDESNLEMIAVSTRKKTADNLQEGFNILRTPTIIFYKNDKEIGRYVEYARETLEKDILKILKKKPYKHVYDST